MLSIRVKVWAGSHVCLRCAQFLSFSTSILKLSLTCVFGDTCRTMRISILTLSYLPCRGDGKTLLGSSFLRGSGKPRLELYALRRSGRISLRRNWTNPFWIHWGCGMKTLLDCRTRPSVSFLLQRTITSRSVRSLFVRFSGTRQMAGTRVPFRSRMSERQLGWFLPELVNGLSVKF